MSYTASYFHIVFGTYRREYVLSPEIQDDFKSYIGGVLRNYGSKLLCANYMPDHVHLLINLSVEQPLAKVVGAVKQSTSLWLKRDGKCPRFVKWSKEYYGVSLSPDRLPDVERYITNQQEHHRKRTFDEELNMLISKLGVERFPQSFYE